MKKTLVLLACSLLTPVAAVAQAPVARSFQPAPNGHGITVLARADAISDAHAKALAIAKQLGVALGGVSNVNAFDQTSPDGTCSSQYVVGAMGAQFGPGSDNTDADYITVSVAESVTITYGIR